MRKGEEKMGLDYSWGKITEINRFTTPTGGKHQTSLVKRKQPFHFPGATHRNALAKKHWTQCACPSARELPPAHARAAPQAAGPK